MLASLFGDIATLRQQAVRSAEAAEGAGEHGFAQTAVMETADDEAPFNVHAKVAMSPNRDASIGCAPAGKGVTTDRTEPAGRQV